MKNETDDRRIEDITFAQDIADPDRHKAAVLSIRSLFQSARAIIAQDVIDLGCTGLVDRLTADARLAADAMRAYVTIPPYSIITRIAFAREHMAGAGFGIPCYVPPNRFCLVHNTIGGLQPNQVARHQDALDLVSRELTPEEAKHAAAMGAFIKEEGVKKAKRDFGAEEVKNEPEDVSENEPGEASVRTGLTHAFTCPEHASIVWQCRYCLAAAVISGPFQPEVFLEVEMPDGKLDSVDIERLDGILRNESHEGAAHVRAFVRVRQWDRKLVVVVE